MLPTSDINRKNAKNLPDGLFLEGGRIINLKIFVASKNTQTISPSPYILNLKENKKPVPNWQNIPNLLNLKKIGLELESQEKQAVTLPKKRELLEQPTLPSNPLTLYQKGNIRKRKFWQRETFRFKKTPAYSPVFTHSVKAEAVGKVNLYQPERDYAQFSATPLHFFSFNAQKKKTLALFTLLCLFFSALISASAFLQKAFDLKNTVLQKVNTAYAQLNDAQAYLGSQDYQEASSSFQKASENFAVAMTETQKLGKITAQALEVMPLASKITNGPRLLQIGENIASTGEYLMRALEPFQNMNSIYGNNAENENQGKLKFTQAIAESRDNLEIALLNIQRAKAEGEKINANQLDQDIKEKVKFLQQNIPFLETSLTKTLETTDYILDILGHKYPKRYLLLFQNNNELRATGGFIGSYGILDLDGGQIKKLEIDGIYNPDGQLLSKIGPPPPIRFTNTRWYSRDANWFPDFPTSAAKVAWFLEKTGEPSVDGVIALTPQVMIELLKITGPIAMPEYDTTVSADNFVMQTQREVELEYDRELNRPKQFIADLAPHVLDKILNSEKPEWFSLLGVLSKMLEEKHLILYFSNQDLEKFVVNEGWAGEMKENSQDYLQLVNTNINGGKTDGMIEESINLESTVNSDGSIINTVEITRRHTGNNDWPSINNIDYLRLYVPAGSTLLSASGFSRVNIPPLSYEEMQYEKDPLLEEIAKTQRKDEASGTDITQEFGKTCFGNWVAVKPQEEVKVRFQYQLPFQIKPQVFNDINKYTILVQKQAGSFGSAFHFRLNLPDNLKMIWKYPDVVNASGSQVISWDAILDADKYLGVAVEKQ